MASDLHSNTSESRWKMKLEDEFTLLCKLLKPMPNFFTICISNKLYEGLLCSGCVDWQRALWSNSWGCATWPMADDNGIVKQDTAYPRWQNMKIPKNLNYYVINHMTPSRGDLEPHRWTFVEPNIRWRTGEFWRSFWVRDACFLVVSDVCWIWEHGGLTVSPSLEYIRCISNSLQRGEGEKPSEFLKEILNWAQNKFSAIGCFFSHQIELFENRLADIGHKIL